MKSSFRTKAEAIQAGTQAMNEYNQSGQTFTPSELSIANYLDYWFDNYCKINLKYSTQLGYIQIIENHLKRNYGVDVRKVLEQKGKKEEKSAWCF